MTFGI